MALGTAHLLLLSNSETSYHCSSSAQVPQLRAADWGPVLLDKSSTGRNDLLSVDWKKVQVPFGV